MALSHGGSCCQCQELCAARRCAISQAHLSLGNYYKSCLPHAASGPSMDGLLHWSHLSPGNSRYYRIISTPTIQGKQPATADSRLSFLCCFHRQKPVRHRFLGPCAPVREVTRGTTAARRCSNIDPHTLKRARTNFTSAIVGACYRLQHRQETI